MTTLTTSEVETLLNNHHAGLVILLPGSATSCTRTAAIMTEQKIQVGLGGCPACTMYALRALMEREPRLKQLVIDALSNINP